MHHELDIKVFTVKPLLISNGNSHDWKIETD